MRAASAFLKPPALIQLTEGATGLARLRATDPPAFAQALTRAGLYPAPVFDLVDMSDVLARRYARDVDLGWSGWSADVFVETRKYLVEVRQVRGRQAGAQLRAVTDDGETRAGGHAA